MTLPGSHSRGCEMEIGATKRKADALPVVVTETERDVGVEPATVSDGGVTEHTAATGAPAQEKLTVPV